MDREGHYDMIVARRESAMSRLTPEARARRFPRIYAQSLPAVDTESKLRAEIVVLKADNKRLLAEVDLLKAKAEKVAQAYAPVNCLAVMTAFCKVMAAMNQKIEGRDWTVADLTAQRRHRNYAWPRHIAMLLCCRICKRASLPIIGKAFQRDHTSIMHGRDHAPEVLALCPELNAVALLVEGQFKTGENAGAGAP